MPPLLAIFALAVARPSPDGLLCTARHDRIAITLPADIDRRIGSMAVVRGGRWAFLVDDQNHYAPFRPGVRRLTLRPSGQLGAVDGRPVRAFPRSGVYRIVFADNLETEPENMIALDCIVRVR